MCGIIGILSQFPVQELIYTGLMHLQHRGQDAAGIFSYNPFKGSHALHKKKGLVQHLFTRDLPLVDSAYWAIGHLRYGTSGNGEVRDAQPFAIEQMGTWISIAHNGNLVNYAQLKREMPYTPFTTTCDSEALLHLFAEGFASEGSPFDRIRRGAERILSKAVGAYSLIGLIAGVGLFALRDPHGFRPLLLGRGPTHTAVASETLALSRINCTALEDVNPGELLYLRPSGQIERESLTCQRHAHCSFEFNYFAKTSSILDRREVYTVRSTLGVFLGEKIKQTGYAGEIVVPVPDTGIPAAMSLARTLNLPLAEGLVRQSHIGRTFIMPEQQKRQTATFHKLSPIRSVFEGKSVILVDDSIIRGTVSQKVVLMVREAGAKQVLFASTFPPVRYPCIYGIDFARQEELLAWNKPISEIAEEIGADWVVYNDIPSLKQAIGLDDLCLACIQGSYPTSLDGLQALQEQRALAR